MALIRPGKPLPNFTYNWNSHEMRSMRCGADLTFVESCVWQLGGIDAQSVLIGSVVVKHFDSMGGGVDKVVDS